jgi:hypothetical protein
MNLITRKPWKAALSLALAGAMAIGFVQSATAAPVSICTESLTGAAAEPPDLDVVGNGLFELFLDDVSGELSLEITFSGIADIASIGLFSDEGSSATEIVNIAGANPTSPVTYILQEADLTAIIGSLDQGKRVLVSVVGATDTIAASFGPCIGRPDGFAYLCGLDLSATALNPPSETSATGTADVQLNSETGNVFVTVDYEGVASPTAVGIFALTESGGLEEIFNIDDGTGGTPVSITLTPAQQDQVTAAQEAFGAVIAVVGGADTIAVNLDDCGGGAEGEGEGTIEGIVEGGIEGEGEGVIEGEVNLGNLRFVHGAASFGNVDVCLNNSVVTDPGGFAFGTIGEYGGLVSGFYDIEVVAAGDGCEGTIIASNSFFLPIGASYTIVFNDSLAKGAPVGNVSVFLDDNTPGTAGFAKVRAFNLSPDAPTVDINEDSDALGDTPLFDNLTYGTPSAYTEVAPQNFRASVRTPDNGVVLIDSPDAIALGDGGVYSIFVLGLTTGDPAISVGNSSEVQGGPVEGEPEGEGEGVLEGEGEGVVEGVVEGEGEGDVAGPVDFCALQDELSGIVSDPIIGPVLADLLGEDISLLELLACQVADLNGELPVLEGEGAVEGEPSIADQLPGPNGLLDGPFELAVLAELINNPGPYADLATNGGVDATAVGAAFAANQAIALGTLNGVPPEQLAPLFELLLGDSLPVCGEGAADGEGEGEALCFTQEERDEIILRAAELVPNIGVLLAGYITLGDSNSIAVAVLVLTFIEEATDGILGLGIDPNAYTTLDGILSADEDADGDGCTQRAEFEALGETPDSAAYVAAALDPETADCPQPVDFCALQDELANIVSDPIIGPVLADLLGEDISLLELLACQVADLNGELPVLEGEGEEQSIADQLPGPNGILDGPFELAVLAELINNPGAYSGLLAAGGVDAANVGPTFAANQATALGTLNGVPPEQLAPLFELLLGDALPVCGEGAADGEGEAACFTQEERDEIILRAAELVPNIGILLAGYVTLGDANSIAVAVLVLTFIEEATDGILGLGIDPNAYITLDAILSINGDLDGDGCTQGGEFDALNVKGLDSATYIAAVLDTNVKPAGCEAVEGEGEVEFHRGDTDEDGKMGLGELLRLIQFYNAGEYGCDSGNVEDGYTTGAGTGEFGVGDCVTHDIDFDGVDGVLSLSELLRAIQFFNLDVVLVRNGTTEDGWDFAS